ncbi:MAG: helix-turn-helix domain-containing protein [Oscillospiraceae bacterium]
MINEKLSFDNLPEAVGYLISKIEILEQKIDAIAPTQKAPNTKTTIDINVAAELIQKAKSTIYTMVRLGRIPAYKKGKKLYFIEEELQQWLVDSPTLCAKNNRTETRARKASLEIEKMMKEFRKVSLEDSKK